MNEMAKTSENYVENTKLTQQKVAKKLYKNSKQHNFR